MKNSKIIEGKYFEDERGALTHFNDFDMQPVKRFYKINHHTTDVIRAWQGHKIETKWFYVIKGSFIINLIQLDNWASPSANQAIETFLIKDEDNFILKIPAGFINGFKSIVPDSTLMVFSDTTLQDSIADDYRFDKSLWYNWSTQIIL
jgi:dTDP-4-dehydrorhamnose 3,5-epimerase-like enzyme